MPGEDEGPRSHARRSFHAEFGISTGASGPRHIGGVYWALIGTLPAACMAVCAFLLVDALRKALTYVPTMGEVVEVRSWPSDAPWNRGTPEYAPVFRYVWSDGSVLEATPGLRRAAWNLEIGSQHAISYDPRQRDDVRLPGLHNWVVPAVGVGLSVLALAAAAAIRRRLWRWLEADMPGTPRGGSR